MRLPPRAPALIASEVMRFFSSRVLRRASCIRSTRRRRCLFWRAVQTLDRQPRNRADAPMVALGEVARRLSLGKPPVLLRSSAGSNKYPLHLVERHFLGAA